MSGQEKKIDRTGELIQGVTGVILAGGKSRRYGENKALVKINGIRLIDRVVTVMRAVFQRIILITNTPEVYIDLELPMVPDLIKGLGPIGGIYTGLSTIPDPAGFFVACDMPFLNEALIRHISLIREGFDAVIPRRDWKIEALHALYTKQCLPAIIELIHAKEYQVKKFFLAIRSKYIEEAEIVSFDPYCLSLININRPQEMEIAERLLGRNHTNLESKKGEGYD